ncbi:MAG TPA: hypothetical protein VK667_03725 [Ktedonobacteraceae bacterium]|nr:hypothetical protein [Ktedonobacteraceae bacterium]
MAFLSDLADGLIKSVTGQSPSELQAQATEASDQLKLAFQTLIIENAVIIAELFIIAALIFKRRE